ncbi:hypothetical protein C8J36_101109 [Rhizobium sp. PP-F2F-G48]|nr:hypothetical protein C8J36_101109 [Rhizobium sp. PP-F2F-G48]
MEEIFSPTFAKDHPAMNWNVKKSWTFMCKS